MIYKRYLEREMPRENVLLLRPCMAQLAKFVDG